MSAELFHDGCLKVLHGYSVARTETFKGHPLAAFMRDDLADALRQIVPEKFLVKGSVGNGNWAETPLVAVFDPAITTSAQRGVYVVYLFDSTGSGLYLSLNQATTEVKEEFKRDYAAVLKGRASQIQQMIKPFGLAGLDLTELALEGSRPLTRGYCAGNIAAYEYNVDSLPAPSVMKADLEKLLSLYEFYAKLSGGEIGLDDDLPDDIGVGAYTGTEAKKFRWHRTAERNQKLAAAAKQVHGSTCMVCGFNFGSRYGDWGAGYIEAHHVVPFSELSKAPEPVLLDPATDFVVVCANCHRMLHRKKQAILPSDLKDLLQ